MSDVRSGFLESASGRWGAALPALACRTLARAMSMSGLGRRLSILIYHRVLAQADPLFPDEIEARRFDRQLAFIRKSFNVIALRDAVQGLRNGTLPNCAACITFDDGYADNAEIALPILQKHGLPATFFVASGFLNGGRMWNDTVIELIRKAPDALDLSSLGLGKFELDTMPKRQAAIHSLLNTLKYLALESRQAHVDAIGKLARVTLSDSPMMSSGQVRLLHRAGMEIGGHTVNHPILARMDEVVARKEIADGKAALEGIIGAPVRLFAYPNGKPGQDYLPEHVAMLGSLGFDAAVSTSWGAAPPGSDLYQLPRFTPWDRGQFRFTLRMMQNLQRIGQSV